MKTTISITLDYDVYTNDQTRELRNSKKLSSFVNNLLRSSFNISDSLIDKEEEELQQEINKINTKKALLQEKLNSIEERKKKDKSKVLYEIH